MQTSSTPPDTTARPALNPADIRVTLDKLDRTVIVVPDDVARRMRREILDGWREYPGVAYGDSRKFPPGSWLHEVTVALMAAFAASPVPERLDERRRDDAQGSRESSAKGWHLWPDIVGEGDWDDESEWWRDYDTNVHLHVPGSAHTARVAGQDCIQYGG